MPSDTAWECIASWLQTHGLLNVWPAIIDITLLSVCAWLVVLSHRIRREVKVLKAERDVLKIRLTTPPQATDAPTGINPNVLQEVLNVCWSYSLRNRKRGHIMAVGPSSQLLAQGSVQGFDKWQYFPSSSMLEEDHKNEVDKEMNMDGAHIIDGNTGQIVTSKFIVSTSLGSIMALNSGTVACQNLSNVPGSVVMKVSQDGRIKDFRNGVFFQEHYGNRIPQC